MRGSTADMRSSAFGGDPGDAALGGLSADRHEYGLRRNIEAGDRAAALAVGFAGARIARKDLVAVGQRRHRSSTVVTTACRIRMGRSRQAAVGGAHLIGARRACDPQYAAGTLDLAALEELDLDGGKARRRHRPDAAEAQSAPVRGIKRLETAVDFTQSVGLEKEH